MGRNGRSRVYLVVVLITAAFFVVAYLFTMEKSDPLNPFQIGQVVYPSEDFLLTNPTTEEYNLYQKGATVIDMNQELIRLRFADNSEAVYAADWFVAHSPLVLSGEWVLGNQFRVGDVVCAIPVSQGEDIPQKGTVTKVNGNFVYFDDQAISYGHYQKCP